MKKLVVYGETRIVDTLAALDTVGEMLAGRAWDPAQVKVSDYDPEAERRAAEVAEAERQRIEAERLRAEEELKAAAEAALIAQRQADSWNTVGVSELGAERATRDAQTLTSLGFVVPPPIYAVGSLVNSTGVENAKRKRLEHDKKPLLGDAVAQFCEVIRKENRRDVVIEKPRDLEFRDDGTVQLAEGLIAFDQNSFEALTKRLDMPRGAASYLQAVPPDVRAWNMRKWLSQYNGDIKPLRLRLRDGFRAGEVYAVVSAKYVDYGLDLVAKDLLAALEDLPGLRATVDYDGRRMQIDATAFSDVKPERYVAGEVFQVGCRVSSVDDGTGSARGGGSALRNLCLNLMILANIQDGGFSVAHRGTRDAFRIALREGYEQGARAARTFVRQWNSETQTADFRGQVRPVDGESAVPSGNDSYSLNQLLFGLFLAEQARGSIPVGQKEIGGIVEAWRKEPETSRKGVANALTRYAHEGQADAWHADDIERAAVSLLVSKRPFEWTEPSALQKRLSA
jgi:hypothetical protein